jgi:DNA-binding CsgD family transcriptional regulator
LHALSNAVAGTGALLLHHDLRHRGSVSEAVGFDPEALALYNAHYHSIDIWACAPRTRAVVGSDAVLPDERLVARQTLRRSEYYNDFISRSDLTRMVALALAPGPVHSGVTIFRGERDPAFGTAEVRFLDALVPHLRRALQVHDRLRTADDERLALLECLDAVPCAVLMLDQAGRVVVANRAGTMLSVNRDGIGLIEGGLVAASSDATRELQRLCAAVSDRREPPHSGGAMVIQRPSSPVPMQLLVTPVRGCGSLGTTVRRPAALVFVSDPLSDGLPSEALLRHYYGLTKAEAEVAARIGAGRSLQSIADDRGSTIGTIRWYNKQVLAKTGCSSRAELVRQMTRSLPGLFPEQ